ncbi:MAG: hypothetical protein DRN08_05180, partial [Thermoplasmata archaeon]
MINNRLDNRIVVISMLVLTILVAISGITAAKSLYVIANINASPTPIQAYDIQGNSLVFQSEYNVPYFGWGAVGIAIDTESETLFVTYEESNVIQLLDARTFEDLGSTTAPDAENLAGIVVDQDKKLVYTVDRYTPTLYVYEWDADNKTLTLKPGFPIDLPNATSLYGIALDEINDLLYVADSWYDPVNYTDVGVVRYYDTTTWTEQGNFNLSHPPIGIAVDPIRGFVYTVAGYEYSNLLSKYDLATSTETTTDMGHGGMGVAVDPATGLVYVTGGYDGDDLSVWDTTTTPFTQTYSTGYIGDPTGICVPGREISYNPLNLNKNDRVEECVNPGGYINYTICFNNSLNDFDVHNVTLVDTLPENVSFIEASDGGEYADGTVTWEVDTLQGGMENYCVWILVQVDPNTPAGSIIVNHVTIDSDETPPTTQSETTTVCETGTEDTTPPVTTKIIGIPQYQDGLWVTTSTPITLSAVDPGGNASGVKEIHYIINGNETVVEADQVTFTFEEECMHTLEFWAVDNAGNEENHTIQTHYVDDTGPIQTVEFGEPKDENFYQINETWYIGIGKNTPIWINSSDSGCNGGVGSKNLTYEVYWGENFGEWILKKRVTVYDNDENDTNPTVGEISVKIFMNESCWHEIHYWCYDYLGNRNPSMENSFLNIDFIVDADPPETTWYYNGPHYGNYVSTATAKIIHAEDAGCIPGGSGVAWINWRVDKKIGDDQWIVVKSGTVYDNDENDSNSTPGIIEISIHIDEECEHHIYHQAADNFGNIGVEHKQYVRVDDTPPEIFKNIGDPN